MAGSTISTSLTIGVTLDSGVYQSPLTVAATGDIAPSDYAASGLTGGLAAGYTLNEGTIGAGTGAKGVNSAGLGGTGNTGGSGVDFNAGSLVNDGKIKGGAGGTEGNSNDIGGNGGTGGAGVLVVAAP